MTPKLVGFLGFDGVTSVDLTGPVEAFASARIARDGGLTRLPCYELVLIGATNKTFVAESGIVFKAQTTLATAPTLDTLVVPGGEGLREAGTSRVVSAWLKERSKSTRRIAAVGTGIYGLAMANLLNGRGVTTHWRFAKEVAHAFPELRMNYGASFLKDGPFYTSGAGTAGVEMILELIREDYGWQVALSVAREFVLDLKPPGDDERHIDPSAYQAGPIERLAELPAWILEHFHGNLSVEALAQRVYLCPRHFSRLFKQVFRSSPAEFVEQLRLSEARRRLLMAGNSIEGVSVAIGFKSADTFRRAFERRFGVNPSRFRHRFEFTSQGAASNPRDPRTAVIAQRKVWTA
jgi:transcriptional regulator GlxA family with amidase domain